MNGQAIVPFNERVANIQVQIKKYRDVISAVLPRDIDYDRMERIVDIAVRKTPGLSECTPASIVGAVMEAASLGLEPGVLGQAYIIPFRNERAGGRKEAQLIVGYKGLLKLMRNTGEVGPVWAEVVYDSDPVFRYQMGTEPKIEHVPTEAIIEGGTAGRWKHVRASYAVAKLKDGDVQFALMFKRDLERVRAVSKSKDSGPWFTDPEEMAKKSAVRRLAKMLPSTTERVQRIVELDEMAEAKRPQVFANMERLEDIFEGGGEEKKSALDRVVRDGRALRRRPTDEPPDDGPAPGNDVPPSDPGASGVPGDQDLPF